MSLSLSSKILANHQFQNVATP